MKIQQVELSKLNPAKYNPRDISKDQLSALAASLSRYGFVEPVVVNQRNMVIVGGHQRVKAWQGLGESSVPVVFVDLDDAEERALNLALNKISGDWNEEKLSEVIRELKGFDFDDFTSTGFSLDEINGLGGLIGVGERTPTKDPDDIPEPPKTPITQQGDIYEIGNHRLMCGDSSIIQDVGRLMEGEKADMVFTDPPYNLASDSKGSYKGVRENMARLMESEWDKNFDPEKVLENILSVLAPDAVVYVCTSHHLAGKIWEWMKGWAKFHSFCTWAKPNPMPSVTKRHWTFNAELICYATRGKHVCNFPKEGHARSVWEINKINKCDLHPTMKPVEIPLKGIEFSSRPGQLVLDFFGGAGSTMVACQQSGRINRMMEINPVFCDVIVARMKALFPELVVTRNGKPF